MYGKGSVKGLTELFVGSVHPPFKGHHCQELHPFVVWQLLQQSVEVVRMFDLGANISELLEENGL